MLSYLNPACRKWPCFLKWCFIWSFDLVWHQCACHKKTLLSLRIKTYCLHYQRHTYKHTGFCLGALRGISSQPEVSVEQTKRWVQIAAQMKKRIHHPMKSYYRNCRVVFCNQEQAGPIRLLKDALSDFKREAEREEVRLARNLAKAVRGSDPGGRWLTPSC